MQLLKSFSPFFAFFVLSCQLFFSFCLYPCMSLCIEDNNRQHFEKAMKFYRHLPTAHFHK